MQENNSKNETQQNMEALQANSYLNKREIAEHLKNVEYIMMVAPAVHATAQAPIQFTLFLNMQEELPEAVFPQVLTKFLQDNNITRHYNILNTLAPVGFAQTNQETPMPLHIFKKEEEKNIPHTTMYVIDFEGDSPDFQKAKDSLTGWTYSYTND